MKLIPLITEKTMKQVAEGKYTFKVNSGSKNQIRKAIESVFGVHVTNIRTVTLKGGKRKNVKGQMVSKAAYKKAIVALKEKETIKVFETKKEKK
jgi:large subunit ribosomal protein L23